MSCKSALLASLGILSLSNLNSAVMAWPCSYCWNQPDQDSCNNTDGSCAWDGTNDVCEVAQGPCEG